MDTTCPVNCTFTYHSVVPPTHCPYCGRCLGCGGPAPVPVRPWTPTSPYPWQVPTYPYITYS